MYTSLTHERKVNDLFLQQRKFRNNLVTRDEKCAITQEDDMTGTRFEHVLLNACHIIPTSQMSIWNRDYKKYIINEPPSESGESRIYSPRNGLLLAVREHLLFDQYVIGVDAMVRRHTDLHDNRFSKLTSDIIRRTTKLSSSAQTLEALEGNASKPPPFTAPMASLE